MKKIIKPYIFALILLCLMAISQISLAQAPPPPDDKGTETNQGTGSGGGGAPIGGGLFILLGMSAAYGAKKLYNFKKESLEE